jgi:hypothetical protein
MMLSQGYTLREWADNLQVFWMSPALPFPLKLGAIFLLIVLPFVFYFRVPLAAFASRQLHIPLSPRGVGIGAPILSALAGVVLLFSRAQTPVIDWRFGPAGLSAKTLNGMVEMKWEDVASARWDEREHSKSKASLVFLSKDGKEAWLVLYWITPEHRAKVMNFIKPRARGLFNLPELPPEPEEKP